MRHNEELNKLHSFPLPLTKRKRRKTYIHTFSHFLMLLYFLLFYVYVFSPACTCVCQVHAWCSQRSKEGISSPETEVLDACEPTMWILRTKPRSSTRVTKALKC